MEFLGAANAMRGRLAFAGLIALALGLLLMLVPAGGTTPAGAALGESASTGVLPCKRKLTMTAVYRTGGKIRFEGVADTSLSGKLVRVYEIDGDELVASTRIRNDGTWWANSDTPGRDYTWLTKFVSEAGGAQSRWRRLGQAVAIRGRKPVLASSRAGVKSPRTRVQVKVSGDSADQLVVGVQTGCSRYEVEKKFELRTNKFGVATLSLPRPLFGEPYEIYRVSTENGWKISPPIVVKPSFQD